MSAFRAGASKIVHQIAHTKGPSKSNIWDAINFYKGVTKDRVGAAVNVYNIHKENSQRVVMEPNNYHSTATFVTGPRTIIGQVTVVPDPREAPALDMEVVATHMDATQPRVWMIIVHDIETVTSFGTFAGQSGKVGTNEWYGVEAEQAAQAEEVRSMLLNLVAHDPEMRLEAFYDWLKEIGKIAFVQPAHF